MYTVSEDVPNGIEYDPDADAVVLTSEAPGASGEPVRLTSSTFERIWNRLRRGATLSRADTAYESLPALLDGRYRASAVMGMLDTVFEEVEADTEPVRVRLEE